MAYVRWSGPDGPHPYVSQLYIYESIHGGFECCGCTLGEPKLAKMWNCDTAELMAAHVGEHIAAGYQVPDFVIPTLLGQQERKFDPVIAHLIGHATKQGPDARIMSWDADVPVSFRVDPEDFKLPGFDDETS